MLLGGGGFADCCDVEPEAGGDCAWLEVPPAAGACEVVVELFAGAFCVEVPDEGDVAWFEGGDADGWFCVVDLSGFFAGALLGDCAYAAVANAMPIAVVAKKRILIVRSCFEALWGDNPGCGGVFLPVFPDRDTQIHRPARHETHWSKGWQL